MASKSAQLRINDVLYRIHKDISVPLYAKDMAAVAAYSEQHFHRVFKQVVGETFNHYVRRSRLEQAANQLMFDHHSSVLTVAEKCGFSSLSSFSQCFKAHFQMTPGQWRQQEHRQSPPPFLTDTEIQAGYQRVAGRPIPSPKITLLDQQRVAYIRHLGYGRSIACTWQRLKAWALEEGVYESASHIGLHHSNPAWVALPQCRYVACLSISKPIKQRRVVNQLTIPGGLHAVFELTGQYGDLLPWLNNILENWLPSSSYKLQTTPILVHYLKNHFLSEDDAFTVKLCLPISVA